MIPYATLIFQESHLFILSDEEGLFSCSLPPGSIDSVKVQRIGYISKTISSTTLITNPIITLAPNSLTVQSVEVVGEHLPIMGALLEPLSSHVKTHKAGTEDHGKLLRRIPGISIKSYGGPAGVGSLSIDGGPSSHTKVIMDGIDLTSAQNGEADISQLPLPLVENMSYLPYDITNSNNGGSDGVVVLGSGTHPDHINLSVGNFGHRAYDINLRKHILGFWASLQFGQRREAGNYTSTWNQETIERQNNDLDQNFALLKVNGMLGSDFFWQFNAMESQQFRGVAGLVWSPDTASHRNDQLTLLGSTLGWVRSQGSSRLQLSLRKSHENYVNPQLNIDSDHNLQTYHLKLLNTQALGNHIKLFTDFSMDYDWISSVETGEHQRKSYAASLVPEITTLFGIKLNPSLKILTSPGLYEQTLSDLQIHLPINKGPLLHVAMSRGDIYRYPSFNDQFWWPGGNPDLLPEETQVSTAQIQFDLSVFGQLMLQWQQKESDNLIQWMPGFFYWHPENVAKANRESRKAVWQFDKPTWHISSFAHFSLVDTQDKTTGKTLRYAPTQTSAFGLSWAPDSYELNLQYSYISGQISMYDYPKNTMVESTELWSLSLGKTWQSQFGNFTLVLAGENLLDTSYESIRGYPEPGRSYRMTTTIQPFYHSKRN